MDQSADTTGAVQHAVQVSPPIAATGRPRIVFAVLFREQQPFVWRMLRYLGVPEASLDDVTQEVFVIAGRKLEADEDVEQPRAWLFGIARGVASNWRRAASRRQAREQAWSAAAELDTEPPSAERDLRRRQAAASVERFLQELGEPLATTFVLADIEGLTAPEVAEAIGVPLNTVYSRTRTARIRFNRFVESLGAEAP
jgi:RNA polymerase sigma-70 factor (ECF subfamily)